MLAGKLAAVGIVLKSPEQGLCVRQAILQGLIAWSGGRHDLDLAVYARPTQVAEFTRVLCKCFSCGQDSVLPTLRQLLLQTQQAHLMPGLPIEDTAIVTCSACETGNFVVGICTGELKANCGAYVPLVNLVIDAVHGADEKIRVYHCQSCEKCKDYAACNHSI